MLQTKNNNLKFTYVKSLKDNYIWILYNYINHKCIIIDPGSSKETIKKIKKMKLKPTAILITHYHNDHNRGVNSILINFPFIDVYGPKEVQNCNVNKILTDEKTINLLDSEFSIILTPGHTLGHISYYCKPFLFCGDTLFSGGCGKIFNNLYREMFNSLTLISLMPKNTLIFCSHEYTLNNLKFAKKIFPKDKNINFYYQKVKNKTKKNIPTLPVILKIEKRFNIFLRLKKILKKQKKINSTEFRIFKYLRCKKDKFK
ncbi:hydroxyacylglutathione hydrolase [Buchnera aphidicola (Neophyllaphis podocarpi)]|uniref:hydroxyacylglutathione hydrolase n=1 Tax=Buchnera aphidicola TaxID=9 RepID=UPI0031B89A0B